MKLSYTQAIAMLQIDMNNNYHGAIMNHVAINEKAEAVVRLAAIPDPSKANLIDLEKAKEALYSQAQGATNYVPRNSPAHQARGVSLATFHNARHEGAKKLKEALNSHIQETAQKLEMTVPESAFFSTERSVSVS